MINKLIYCIAAFVLVAFVTQDVNAEAPITQYRISSGTSQYNQPEWYPAMISSCNAQASRLSGQIASSATIWRFTGVMLAITPQCRIEMERADNSGGKSWLEWGYATRSYCANGQPPDTSKPLAEQCGSPCPADGTDGPRIEYTSGWRTGPDTNSAWASGGTTVPEFGCYNGCKLKVYGKNPWFKNTPSAKGYYEFGYDLGTLHTGQSCMPNEGDITAGETPEPTTPPPEKNRCPRGTTQIGTDSAGIPICRGEQKAPPENKNTNQTTTNNPDGSKTTKTTETTKNSDGSTTTKTTTTTTNPDGSQTTSEETTTGKTPDGKDGKSDSTDKDREDLCKMNPSLNICKNSQISGTCEAVSCDGDAIQCAIARDVQMAKCKAEKDEQAQKDSSQYSLGNAVMAGNDPMASKLPTKENAQVVNVGGLSATGFAGGGSCFSDKTFTLLGRSFTIPFSSTCQYLIALRYVVMLIALLASFRMLSGAVIRE